MPVPSLYPLFMLNPAEAGGGGFIESLEVVIAADVVVEVDQGGINVVLQSDVVVEIDQSGPTIEVDQGGVDVTVDPDVTIELEC